MNGPGEASQTEIGLTGGGQDNNLLYLSGIPHNKVPSSDIINEVVKLVEEKTKEYLTIMVPIDKVKEIITKHDALEKELSSGNIDPKLFAKKSKEYSNLGDIITIAREYINFENEKKDLLNMLQDKSNDQEIIDLAQKDLNQLIEKKEKYENELKVFLLPKDEDDNKNAIVEIRAGTGGLKPLYFVQTYLECMKKYAPKKWKLESINISKSEAGGFKEVIIFLVNGNDIYSYLNMNQCS